VSQDEYFFEARKSHSSTYVYASMVFKFFWCTVKRKWKLKFLIVSMEKLTNFEDP
jgi:hypothetical protein